MSESKDSALRDASRRIQEALDGFGVGLAVKEFPDSTRTVADAAATIGCTVAQIAKKVSIPNTQYFVRAFSQQYKMPPSTYRQKARGDAGST